MKIGKYSLDFEIGDSGRKSSVSRRVGRQAGVKNERAVKKLLKEAGL